MFFKTQTMLAELDLKPQAKKELADVINNNKYTHWVRHKCENFILLHWKYKQNEKAALKKYAQKSL